MIGQLISNTWLCLITWLVIRTLTLTLVSSFLIGQFISNTVLWLVSWLPWLQSLTISFHTQEQELDQPTLSLSDLSEPWWCCCWWCLLNFIWTLQVYHCGLWTFKKSVVDSWVVCKQVNTNNVVFISYKRMFLFWRHLQKILCNI